MLDPHLLPGLPRLLRRWRRETARETAMPPELLDELEDHLLSLLKEEILRGTPGVQAWTQALSRLGKPAGMDGGPPEHGGFPFSSSRMRSLRPWAAGAILFLALWIMLLLTKRSAVLSPLLTFHIASVSLGYGAVFLGAFLAAVYLIQRLFRSPTLKAYQKRLRLL
ncbi:MAG TPA: hypothetical protein VMN36_05430, partial [Verrucomicrobiales bacterium]|nr:hypothetical protein [Verrucomicrobiales bacterium]